MLPATGIRNLYTISSIILSGEGAAWYRICEEKQDKNTCIIMKYSKLHLAKEAIKHKGFVKKIPDMFRMYNLWRKGVYKVNSVDIILPFLGILYIISPIDLLPEIVLPVVGVLDDLLVLSLALPKLMREVDKFLLWEANRNLSNAEISEAEII